MKPDQLILISDMDGTLLDSQKRISQKNLNAILDFQKRGGIFTVATGRSMVGMRPYYRTMDLRVPVILYNGSCIFDTRENKMIWLEMLPESIKACVRTLAAEFPKLGIQAISESEIYAYHSTPAFVESMRRENLPYVEVKSLEEFPKNWIKTEMTTDLICPDELDCYLENTVPVGCRWLAAGDNAREIMPANVSKGGAARQYLELLKLSGRVLCCIGDHNNDYEMIQTADVGFAVGNALEYIKETADFVVSDNDQDAVAEAIRLMEHL